MRATLFAVSAATLLFVTGCTAPLAAAGGGARNRPPHPQPGPYDLKLIFAGACPSKVEIPPTFQCIEEGSVRADCLDAMVDNDVKMLVVQGDPTGPGNGLEFALDFDPFREMTPRFRTVKAGDVVKLRLDRRLLDDPNVAQKSFAFAVISKNPACKLVDPQIVIRR